MIKIRLQRHGARHAPFYRMVVTPSTTRRDGKFIEVLGTYNPKAHARAEELKLKMDRIDHWLGVGAQPTDTAKSLIRQGRLTPEEWLLKAEREAAKRLARAQKGNVAPAMEESKEETPVVEPEAKPEEVKAEKESPVVETKEKTPVVEPEAKPDEAKAEKETPVVEAKEEIPVVESEAKPEEAKAKKEAPAVEAKEEIPVVESEAKPEEAKAKKEAPAVEAKEEAKEETPVVEPESKPEEAKAEKEAPAVVVKEEESKEG
jgi:small subunit ribosomal protein S16